MNKIDIPNYLEHVLKISVKEASNDELVGLCPSPYHNDRSASWYINRNTGLFHCKSCNFHGNLEWLTKIVLGYERGEITYKKCSGIYNNEDEYLKDKIKELIEVKSKPKKEFDSSSFEYYKNHFNLGPLIDISVMSKIKNFIKGGIISEYNIKHWITPGAYYNKIAIPIYDFDGEFRNIHFRRILDSDPSKYSSLPSKSTEFKADQLLFYNSKVLEKKSEILSGKKLDYVLLTEGCFDSIYMGIHNYPSVSCFTNLVSFEQIQKITEIANSCIIFFDGDYQGELGKYRTYNKLKNYISTYYFSVYNKDPDEITNFFKLDKIIEDVKQ